MAKVYDYNNEEELTTITVDENIDNKYIFNKLKDSEKEVFPSAISREEFDQMMENIDDEWGNKLISVLGLSDGEIEVWAGRPEKIKFCHFRDVDNGIDHGLRRSRNKLTSDYIYRKICEFKPLETQFRTFFTTLI